MVLEGLHILLTYTCNYECDHCFVWGSPWQTGTFTLKKLEEVFRQAREVPSIREIYFEGGEAFLYHPILVEAIGRAKKFGYWTGIVTNGYWATGVEDAWLWLQPLVARGLDKLEVSDDTYHQDDQDGTKVHPALVAAKELFLEASTITIEPPAGVRDEPAPGLPLTGGDVMYRGRAAEKLVEGLPRQPWKNLVDCPYENLLHPSRIHLDPLGNLHICQGIVVGNLFERPLKEIVAGYDGQTHPIVGPLLEGGPAQLVQEYGLDHEAGYVDACHLCFTARQALRSRFPAELGPDQMYGVVGE
jgi:hypothetical protein